VWQARDVQDSPDASLLLGAIADTLEQQVLDHADPSVQHQVRVAANLCRILQREVILAAAADNAARARLATLLGHDGPSHELWRELADRLEAGGSDDDESAVHATLLAIVRDKLAVAKPGYDAYDFAAERA
jgi:hypothetical protein